MGVNECEPVYERKFALSSRERSAAAMKPQEDLDMLSLAFDEERDWPEQGLEGPQVQEKLMDADFFNAFDDDFDEEDILLK